MKTRGVCLFGTAAALGKYRSLPRHTADNHAARQLSGLLGHAFLGPASAPLKSSPVRSLAHPPAHPPACLPAPINPLLLQPPPLQSASETSDASSTFSSEETEDSDPGSDSDSRGDCGRGMGGTGGAAAAAVAGGGGSGGLVPFSLSEIPCVASEAVSEVTGSAASSPFRCALFVGGCAFRAVGMKQLG